MVKRLILPQHRPFAGSGLTRVKVQGWLGSGTGSLDLTGSTRDNQQIGPHFVPPEL